MAKRPVNISMKSGSEQRGLSFDRPVASQIYTFIRDAIVSMELLPGQMISETALADQFGVSRTPVREALIQLANIGFVEVLPQRGTYVSRFSMEKILEARFIREALEVAVVMHLADNVTPEIVQIGEKMIAEQNVAAADDDATAFQRLDDEFHNTLANFTGYSRVATLIEAEKAHMDRVRKLSLHMTGQYKRLISQHTAIIKAIKAGSPDKAAKAMGVHMKDVYNVLQVIPKEHPEYF